MTDVPQKMPIFPIELLNGPRPRSVIAAAAHRAEGVELREQADVDHVSDLLDIREKLRGLQILFDEMVSADRFDRGRQEQRLGEQLMTLISTIDQGLVVARGS